MRKNKLALILMFLYSGMFSANTIFAGNVDVEASLPSGEYNKVIKVELKANDPAAKTFYGFNPNGAPNDLLKYDGPIIIKSSTPLVFWTFITTDNESKIKINNYTLNFPNDIKLGSTAIYENGSLKNVTITNTAASPIDISYWEARNDLGKVVIPEGIELTPGQSYEIIGLTGTGIISLFSPSEEKKDFIEVTEIKKEVAMIQDAQPKIIKRPYVPKKVATISKNTPVAAIETPVVKPQNNDASVPVADITTATTKPEDTLTSPTNTEIAPNNDFNNSIKASLNESTDNSGSTGKFVIIGVIAAAALGGLGRKYLKKS